MGAGVKSSKTYTVREAVEDWLREGLDGTSDRTRALYEGLLGPLLDAIGARPLRVLSAGDVRSGLASSRPLLYAVFADHPARAGAGDPARRGWRPRRAQRRSSGQVAAGPQREAVQIRPALTRGAEVMDKIFGW